MVESDPDVFTVWGRAFHILGAEHEKTKKQKKKKKKKKKKAVKL